MLSVGRTDAHAQRGHIEGCERLWCLRPWVKISEMYIGGFVPSTISILTSPNLVPVYRPCRVPVSNMEPLIATIYSCTSRYLSGWHNSLLTSPLKYPPCGIVVRCLYSPPAFQYRYQMHFYCHHITGPVWGTKLRYIVLVIGPIASEINSHVSLAR